MRNFYCYTDGGYNNLKKCNGYGSMAIISNDEVVHCETTILDVRSSNEAEYQAMINLLQWILEYGGDKKSYNWVIYADSQLVIKQLANGWKCKSENLIPLNKIGKGLLKDFKLAKVSMKWIPRKEMIRWMGH